MLHQSVFSRVVLRPSVFSVCLLASVCGSSATAGSTFCADLTYLLEQSKSGFYAIQSDKRSEHRGFNASKVLENAEYCVIFEDPKKRSYKCTWVFAFGAAEADTLYEQFANGVSECLGSLADRQVDQPVNHPDTYTAYLYTLADTELRVTFKEKSALKSTLVSVVIEGTAIAL